MLILSGCLALSSSVLRSAEDAELALLLLTPRTPSDKEEEGVRGDISDDEGGVFARL